MNADERIMDTVGLRGTRSLKAELCRGRKSGSPRNECEFLEPGSGECLILKRHGVATLVARNLECLWTVILMAINEVWEKGNPKSREIDAKTVLNALRRVRTLGKPNIEALYKYISRMVWSLSWKGQGETRDSNATRRVCRNCKHFLPSIKACGHDLALEVTGTARCARARFERRPGAGVTELCGNCLHYEPHRLGCRLDRDVEVSSVSKCRIEGFKYAAPEITRNLEVIDDGRDATEIEQADLKIAVESVIFTVKRAHERARPHSVEKRNLKRMYDLILEIREADMEIREADMEIREVKDPVAEVVGRLAERWGVDRHTVRNYLREIRTILKNEARARRRRHERRGHEMGGARTLAPESPTALQPRPTGRGLLRPNKSSDCRFRKNDEN